MNNHHGNFRKTWYAVTYAMFLFFLLQSLAIQAEVTLPFILSDNMVLQRDIPVNIWGWAKPGEKVTVTVLKQKVSVKTDAKGEWKVKLNPLPAGGPFDITITGKNTIVLKNILAGDVWVCSGQSNMEFPLSQSRNWGTDRASTENSQIRLFYVPKKISSKPLQNTDEAKWELCNEKSAAVFSAVGYYFGVDLNKKIGVPIGLINSNWGGTDIETWTSLETMYADKDYTAVIEKMKSANLEELNRQAEKLQKEWQNKIDQEDPGIKEKWYMPSSNSTGWKEMKLPQAWEGAGLPALDGVVWFKKEVVLTAADAGKEAKLSLGPIDDSDLTFVNGTQVGETINRYNLPREYTIKPGILKEGKNLIAIKVIDTGGGGGVNGDAKQMKLEVNGNLQSLAGEWSYKVGLDLPSPRSASSPNSFPSLLYNGMINPLINFSIKGVIWYQGENNAGNYVKYRSLFPAMINDWRNKWKIGDFTFLFVQLANYMEPVEVPQESSWAGLREAQTMALTLPKTGMAVIIDIGEAKDIHPKDKDNVGYRLSLAAQKVTYGKDIVYSGPTYKSMEVSGNSITLEFSNTGSGLMVKDKYGYLKSFMIAGADKKFVWARATVVPGNKVIISSDAVKNPVAVRYAWADNPDDANLYNKEGLPASPFRTDNW
jgi:sialate O-acetylesterase